MIVCERKMCLYCCAYNELPLETIACESGAARSVRTLGNVVGHSPSQWKNVRHSASPLHRTLAHGVAKRRVLSHKLASAALHLADNLQATIAPSTPESRYELRLEWTQPPTALPGVGPSHSLVSRALFCRYVRCHSSQLMTCSHLFPYWSLPRSCSQARFSSPSHSFD